MRSRIKVLLCVATVIGLTLIAAPSYIAHRNRYRSAADTMNDAFQKRLAEYRAFIRADAHADARGDGVPARYQAIYEGGFGAQHLEMARAELPFESITLERTGCLGACPAYKVTFFRSGAARFEAFSSMPLRGTFEGEVRIERFTRLCFAIERLGFASFKPDYRAAWTDDATCIVTVSGGKSSKRVSDYGQVGPIELWIIQSILDLAREEVRWTPAKEPNFERPEGTPGKSPSSDPSQVPGVLHP